MGAKRSEPNQFRPEDYRESAVAKLVEARKALECQLPGLALYLAGVSVECILRAHLPDTARFDGRHDLARIGDVVGFVGSGDGRFVHRRRAVVAVVRLWRNNYQYMSDAKIGRVLHAAGEYPKLRRRAVALVRTAAAEAIDSATILLESGKENR